MKKLLLATATGMPTNLHALVGLLLLAGVGLWSIMMRLGFQPLDQINPEAAWNFRLLLRTVLNWLMGL
jgi:hypothetical protein